MTPTAGFDPRPQVDSRLAICSEWQSVCKCRTEVVPRGHSRSQVALTTRAVRNWLIPIEGHDRAPRP